MLGWTRMDEMVALETFPKAYADSNLSFSIGASSSCFLAHMETYDRGPHPTLGSSANSRYAAGLLNQNYEIGHLLFLRELSAQLKVSRYHSEGIQIYCFSKYQQTMDRFLTVTQMDLEKAKRRKSS